MSNIVAQLQSFLGQKAGGLNNMKNGETKPQAEDKTEELKEAKVEDPKARALELATDIAVALSDGRKD